MENKNAWEWTCEDVGAWLADNGFHKYEEKFSVDHKIDGQVLLSLKEQDLREPPMSILCLGDIKRLTSKIRGLRSQSPPPSSNLTASEAVYIRNQSRSRDRTRGFSPHAFHNRNFSPQEGRSRRVHTRRDSTESEDFENSSSRVGQDYSADQRTSLDKDIPPELWKTTLSALYLFVTFLITAFVMTIVHDRVPEMSKYPPLPDLFLDNMPYVVWAFDACEMCGLVLTITWLTLLFFHKHRFVLMRRMFSLMGTIFLLRCVTMLITSLSVPGKHLQCSGGRYGDFYSRLHRAFDIWSGFGMSLQGVRTCGDYMFSGHTSVITLLNFFITEYTPRKFYFVHILSWCLNFFGIFFVLAAHEHYSIDVFMAFYLSSRLFMYYHTLANNRALLQPDARRTRAWFPLFSFFESKCQTRVPNVLEWPLPLMGPLVLIAWPRFVAHVQGAAAYIQGLISNGGGRGEQT